MRSPDGYATITHPDRPLQEYDTASCCHCSAVIFVKPGTAATVYLEATPQGWREVAGCSCYHCWKPVCLVCHADGRCRPLEQMLEQVERHARRH